MTLPQVLPIPAREIWMRQFRAAWDCAPARTREEREQTLEQVLTKIQPGSIAVEKVGPSPSQAFEIGESLYPEVPWASGLVSLSWASPYFPHVIATIGHCIAIRDDETLQPMWHGLFAILDMIGLPRLPDSAANQYAASLTWKNEQHLLLRNAWGKWIDSKEDDRAMLSGIQAYLALSRLPSGATFDEGLMVVRAAARAVIEDQMRAEHPDWGGYPDWVEHPDDLSKQQIEERDRAIFED